MYMLAKRISDKMRIGTARPKNGQTRAYPTEKWGRFVPKGLKIALFTGFRPHCYIMATMGLKLPFTSKLTQRNAYFRGKKGRHFRDG
ncbi:MULTISPECIES: hypothetical protein [unclassified Mesorhizobium]|uniref:hypothetical protein n=1 Tax=unclassified Mesorhizobium TaxID=325217 RepID=UPI00115D389F|nr:MULTISPECIES: hypothetical protein [unclassified Mesorhizobium]TRC89213.1 hypothetical protein FJV80_10760 [Mesorhizobium sp. WSM4310]